MHPHLARDRRATARFLREGRAVSRIAHPNVIEIFDVGEFEDVPYLVMALVEGEDLGEHLRRRHPMSATAIADVLLPVVAGLAAAHEVGIVHRDLKPSNIRVMVDPRRSLVPVVLDFGVSKILGEHQDANLTASDGILGTAAYMAPEQLRSAKAVDARTDVYALGVILYQCATGARPFEASNPYDLMHAVLTAPVRSPRDVRPDLSPGFEGVVMRAMRRAPEERFASARALGRALVPFASEPGAWSGEFLTGGESSPTTGRLDSLDEENSLTLVSETNVRSSRSRSRSPQLALATGAATLTLLLLAAGFVGRTPAAGLRSGDLKTVPSTLSRAIVPLSSSSGPVESMGTHPDALAGSSVGGTVHPSLTTPTTPLRPAVHGAGRGRLALPSHSGETATSEPVEELGTNGAPILE